MANEEIRDVKAEKLKTSKKSNEIGNMEVINYIPVMEEEVERQEKACGEMLKKALEYVPAKNRKEFEEVVVKYGWQKAVIEKNKFLMEVLKGEEDLVQEVINLVHLRKLNFWFGTRKVFFEKDELRETRKRQKKDSG